jgi:ribosomal protein L20A (L18A)
MEQRDQEELGGAVQGGTVYASADFPDAEPLDSKPSVSLSRAVTNVVLFHVSDAVERQTQHRTWRKKVKEIMQNHQEKILEFFTKPITDEHPLKSAHTLLTKYGKISTHDINRQVVPQFFKEYIVEAPQTGIKQLNEYLTTLFDSRSSDTPVNKWINVSKHMLDYLRDVGDELIRLDHRLQMECQRIDSIIEKVSQLIALPNPEIEGFQEMMDKYIEKQFETNQLEKLYWDFIFTLQKYSALRDILIPQRIANQAEPLCCVCMTDIVSVASTPCGHTFCFNCSKRSIICHICRQHILTRVKIYFS